MIPPTIIWYKIAKEAVNYDAYAKAGLKDIQTPDLDDMSYLDKPLREAWKREQANLKAKAEEKRRVAEATKARRRR